MYGLGNWGAVGEHVNRGAAECAAHYERIYLRSPAFPEPTPAPEMAGVRIPVPIAPPQRVDFAVLSFLFCVLGFPSSSFLPVLIWLYRGGAVPTYSLNPPLFEADHARRPAQFNCCLSRLLQIDPAAWIKERQRTRQEPGEAQAQAATRTKAGSGAAGADGKLAAAELAEASQQPNGVAAGSAGNEEVAGEPPAQGGADGTGVVKAEPQAEAATQPHGATEAAAGATSSAPVSARSGDAEVDAAANGADAGASQRAVVKQDDNSKPQVNSRVNFSSAQTYSEPRCAL